MSVSGKLVLAIKMLLESQQYKAELNQAVSDTQAAAAKVEGSTKGMGDAVQAAVQGQSAAVRSAASALSALGPVAGAAVLVAGAVGLAYHQAGQETLAFEKAIILTGNRAGVTSGQLADMARAIDGVAGTQATAAAALATMTATGQVARENLQKVSLAAVEMERATGQSIGETAKIFADLGKEPVKASVRLNESMNYLTAGTYEQIKAAEELGDKETAASIAQNAFADAARQRAAGVEQNLGLVERAWRSAGDAAKWAWDRFLDIGRPEAPDQQLKELQKKIAEKEKQLATTGFGENAGGAAFGRPSTAAVDRLKAEIAALGAKAAALQGEAYQASESANAERERAEAVKASIALSDEAGKRDSALEKTRKAVAQATQQYTTAIKNEGLTQQERAQIDANYLKVVSDLTKVKEKSAGASKTAASDAEKLTKAGTALTASLLAQDSGLSGDFAQKWESLNAAYRAGETSVEELTAAQAKLLSQQPLMKKAADEEAKATQELAKEREKALATLGKDLEKTLAAVAAQDEQNARLGLSKEAIAELDAAKLEMLATDMELQAANALFLNQDGEIYQALIKQANAYRDLARAKREGGAKQAGIDAAKEAEKEAKKASDEWERAGERIEQSLTDSLMRGFESGKTAAENLRDTVTNMFKTMVLRPIISAAMSPVAGAVNGMLYGNAAAAAGGGASALGMLGSGANLITGLQGTQGMLGTVGGWLGLNTVAANAQLAASLGIDAASAAAAANAAGAAGGGLLSGVGAALPWIGGIAALASILGGLDDSGTYHTGGAAQYSAATGLRTSLGFRDNEEGLPSYNPRDNIDNQFGTGFGYVVRGDQTISAVSAIAQGLGTALDGVAVAFGQKAGYEIATAYADDAGSSDGGWGALRISREGQELLNWQDTRTSRWAPKEFGDGEAGYKEYLAAVAKDTRQVLLDMDLPSWADNMLTSIGDSASMEQLTGVLTQIGVVQSAFVSLGKSMEMFSGLTDEMQSGLLTAAGSIDALTAGAGAFYQGFYSEQERIDAAVAQLNEALTGLDLSIDPTMGDDAKAQFRAAVEAAFAAGDADLAAGLLSISGNFATAADYFEQLSQSAAQAAEQAAQVAERPAAEQASIASDLRRQIYELTGDTAAIRQLEIAGMNAANIALYDRVQALQAEAEQAAIRADLERQVLELTGDTAAIRQLEIAGMDAANVALYDRIQALQSEQQAAEAAAQAAAEQANISESLNRQLIQLTGDTAAIRQLEIAGMNAANVALYDRIQALQSEQQAQAEAQRAAEQAAQAQLEAQQRTAETMQRLQIELYRAQGDNLSAVVLERERELAALAQFGPAAVAMQQQIYGLIDAMAASNAAAASYFAGIDRIAAEQGYNEQAQSAIDALFGAVGSGAASASQAAADAAKSAAASWRSAASSIQSSLDKLRASTTALSDPASRYAETKSVLDEYTRLALGGDASAAEKLAGAADAFLAASEGGTMTQAEYLRDRVLTEAKLASVMESSEAQASLQESIATAASAAVSELQTLNNNLTGFAGDLYDLLRSSAYSGVGREDATGIAATFAKMQADFEAYFSDNARFAVGSQYSDPSFGGASFTKLDNNIAQFTGAEGGVSYLRAGESLLDVAKRIPELRKLWEQSYNVSLPAFAVGTNYVPRDMTARIHEGEAIVPKAFNPWANGGGSTGADNAEVVAELRAVTAQLVKLEARLAEIEKTNDQMAQQQDNGTDGGNAYRAEIMNVDALAQAIKEATV